MTRPKSESVLARRVGTERQESYPRTDGARRRPLGRTPDTLVVEEPLEIQLNGQTVASTMRTPGNDFELAVGFLWAEGVLNGRQIHAIRYCTNTGMVAHSPDAASDLDATVGSGADRHNATYHSSTHNASTYNTVNVEASGGSAAITRRISPVTSACGACGVDAIDELTERLRGLGPYTEWPTDLLVSLPERMRLGQELFAATGAVHGAAVVNRGGEVIVTREDIGRHNAADKVVGRLVLDRRLPAQRNTADRQPSPSGTGGDLALVTSGRASFEMVQKAWAAGFTALVAPSGVSNLAVATARRAGMTLMGFSRNGSGVLYSPLT